MKLEEVATDAIRRLGDIPDELRNWYAALDTHQQRWIKTGLTVAITGAGLETLRRASMPKKVFHSFHYDRDVWRVSQIRNIGAIEGQPLLQSNEWEEVKRGGDSAIQRWIDGQMKGKECVVVLAGRETAKRKWVDYEIKEGWGAGMGVLGVHIHRLEDQSGAQDLKGANPFDHLELGGKRFSSIVACYDPPQLTGQGVYTYIRENIESWVAEAIRIRKSY